jgi:hypothetical protein
MNLPNLRTILVFVLALLIGTFLVSMANTHIILGGLTEIGAQIPTAVRLDAIQRDLLGFGPSLLGVLLIGFLVAFPTAGWVASLLGQTWRRTSFTIAGGIAVIVIMLAIKAFYGQVLHSTITPIASSRTLSGLLTLAIGGAGAGFFFALLKPPTK